MYSVHYTVYITVYIIQYTVYIIEYKIQCTLYSIQCTVYIMQCTIQCTLYSIQFTCEYSGDPRGHQPHSQAAGPAPGQGAAGDTVTTQFTLCEEYNLTFVRNTVTTW